MTGRVFVDTSAWFALANRGDRDHESMRAVLESHEGRLVTSNFVLDETITLCRLRLGHASAVRVGTGLRSGQIADVVRATTADENAAWTLFEQRADQRYSFTDCVSFAMMRRMKIDAAAALDEDFDRERFTVLR